MCHEDVRCISSHTESIYLTFYLFVFGSLFEILQRWAQGSAELHKHSSVDLISFCSLTEHSVMSGNALLQRYIATSVSVKG